MVPRVALIKSPSGGSIPLTSTMESTKQDRSIASPRTLLEAVTYFSDVDVATEHFARLRWPEGPTCSRCGSQEYSYLKTRRLWKCKGCKYQYSVKKGTIFEDSAIGLDKWLPAVWLVASCKNGISSHEAARALGVCQKTAWFMLHRIRLAMQTGSFEKFSEKFDGAVEVDETLIGGKARNLKLARRRELAGPDGRIDASVNKTAVMGFRQRDGQVAVTVIDGRKKGALQREVRRHVKPDATVITDELGSYRGLDEHYQHMVINHAEKYVDGQVHTNGIENFWALLKRGLSGTYVSVRPFHLFRYLDEQVYRYNRREDEDAERFLGVLVGTQGKQLTWAELTSKQPKKGAPPPPAPVVSRRRVLPQRPFRGLSDL